MKIGKWTIECGHYHKGHYWRWKAWGYVKPMLYDGEVASCFCFGLFVIGWKRIAIKDDYKSI